jgi:hypothetical protein
MPASSDGIVTASLMADGLTVKLAVDFGVAGSPLSGNATTVYGVAVTELTTGNQVRGMSVAAAGATTGVDHEAPLGVSLSYQAAALDAHGAKLTTSTAASITVPVPATGKGTWLKSLATPALSCNVITGMLPTWSADISTGVLQVIGRPDPVVVQDVREYESGTLEVLTRTSSEEAALLALLKSPGPYLLQWPASGSADRYVTVGKYDRKRTSNQFGDPYRLWTLPLTQVARPAVAGWSVAIPGRTYADTAATLATYAARTGTYAARTQ